MSSEVTLSTSQGSKIDVKDLVKLFGVETFAAFIASACVAPAVSIIDKAIVSNASGRQRLLPALMDGFKTLVSNPVTFFGQRSFMLVWGVYMGTYMTANCVHGFCDRWRQGNWQMPTFIASSIANIGLCLYKDSQFAKMFAAPGKLPVPLPLITYGLFSFRDALTVAASFNLPVIAADKLQDWAKKSMETSSFAKWLNDKENRSRTVAQISVPMAIQLLSTPIHLLALDLYNRPTLAHQTKINQVLGTTGTTSAPTLSNRAQFVAKEYSPSVLARMGRILPAFGIGGVFNAKLRAIGHDHLGW